MGTGGRARGGARTVKVGAVLGALAMLAGACGGGGGKSSTGASGKDTSGAVGTNLTPKSGGSLIVGTEAEVTSGFDPTNSQWDATGYLYAQTVMDPLVALGADGTYQPYLAQSLTPNADNTVWTFKLRPNIKFINDEPFNADALKQNLEAHRKSFLTGHTLTDVASVDVVDDLTLAVKMKSPWSAFPSLMAGQPGYPIAPKSLADKDRAQHPVGTGPFIFKEWQTNSHFTATKNPNYWRQGYPRLDSIEFRPLIDPQSRENSLKAGTVDLIHTWEPQTILDFRKTSPGKFIEETKGRVEEDFVMLNTSKPPLDDVRVRMALAYATDRVRINQIHNLGVFKVADGPFSSGSGYTNAPGYPSFDLQKAKDLIKQYKQDKGVSSVSFEFATTNVGQNLQAVQLLNDMWSQAGVSPRVNQIEQSAFINNALLGKFEAYTWRQFGEADPDIDKLWWDSANALPNGQIALNFARNKNPKIDQDLADARLTSDPAKRKALYEDVSAQFNKDIPYIWTNQLEWAFAAKADVEAIDTPTNPEGVALRGLQGGVFAISQLWRNK